MSISNHFTSDGDEEILHPEVRLSYVHIATLAAASSFNNSKNQYFPPKTFIYLSTDCLTGLGGFLFSGEVLSSADVPSSRLVCVLV